MAPPTLCVRVIDPQERRAEPLAARRLGAEGRLIEDAVHLAEPRAARDTDLLAEGALAAVEDHDVVLHVTLGAEHVSPGAFLPSQGPAMPAALIVVAVRATARRDLGAIPVEEAHGAHPSQITKISRSATSTTRVVPARQCFSKSWTVDGERVVALIETDFH